ncbi:protease (plasmid) [Shigella sonnei]|uniref:omptin family outer membrane protease IcsP n=1 Tax=Shigella sonnei TaxID=624 RepID=UPI0006631080|nr:omptin family outer membrane protease IcsP [Shigella sonnei]ALZ58753.1 protease [Shigella sonnei]CSO43936.1 outer membrane protease [Shigella sonnei]
MKLKFLVLALCVPAIFTTHATTNYPLFIPDNISTDISLGSLSGKTKERVYHPKEGGRKISQLDWKYSNATIVRGGIDWKLIPKVSFGVSGWTTLGNQKASMVDKDWNNSNTPQVWTDQSWHPNTHLRDANEFELNLKGWLLNNLDYRLGLIAGYQESRYSFNAMGGSYIYSENGGNRNKKGAHPSGERTIDYKQLFKIPYIGLTANYRHENFEFGAELKYSGWVRSSDTDKHYQTEIIFKDEIKNQNYCSVAANIGYYVTPSAKFYIEGSRNYISNKKGDTSLYEQSTNISGTIKNSASIEYIGFLTSAGIKYIF